MNEIIRTKRLYKHGNVGSGHPSVRAWPSGLRRRTQVANDFLPTLKHGRVMRSRKGREFESHCTQLSFAFCFSFASFSFFIPSSFAISPTGEWVLDVGCRKILEGSRKRGNDAPGHRNA